MIGYLNRFTIITADAVLFGLSYLLAYWMRFETFLSLEKYLFIKTFWWVIPVKMGCAYYFSLYRGMWRYTSLADVFNIAKMAVVSLMIITSMQLYYFSFSGFSRSVFLIDCLLTFVLISGVRVLIRFALTSDVLIPGSSFILRKKSVLQARKNEVLIYGAGNAGEAMLRSMINSERKRSWVVGFLDDDPRKKGRSIHGKKVLGDSTQISRLFKVYKITELLIAAKLEASVIEEVNALCLENCVKCRIVPTYSDIVSGDIHMSKIRDIDISDLLHRDSVQVDFTAVRQCIGGKRVMITGAGGSIGSQLVRQILEFSPSQMILIDKCENYLFELTRELDGNEGKTNISYHCTDVTIQKKVDRIFDHYRPEIVFHAAANKHVPLMEVNKDAVLYNNVFGTKIVADLSEKYGTNIFLLVSTDKVVNPKNAMGVSKRLCEIYLQGISRNSRVSFVTVRFGNVLGSNGSVVPIFKEQIKSGGPVTVTHPDVTRYFMTIPEAVLLILQSSAIGKGGEIFLLDMGAPVKIVELAQRMISLTGCDGSVGIHFSGLREGEKLHEVLVGEGEVQSETTHEKISMLKHREPVSPDLVDDINMLCTQLQEGMNEETAYSSAKSIVGHGEKEFLSAGVN